MYPLKDVRDERIKVLKIMLTDLQREGDNLNNQVARINTELKLLEMIEWLE